MELNLRFLVREWFTEDEKSWARDGEPSRDMVRRATGGEERMAWRGDERAARGAGGGMLINVSSSASSKRAGSDAIIVASEEGSAGSLSLTSILLLGNGGWGADELRLSSLGGWDKTFMLGPEDEAGRRQGFSLTKVASIPGAMAQ